MKEESKKDEEALEEKVVELAKSMAVNLRAVDILLACNVHCRL